MPIRSSIICVLFLLSASANRALAERLFASDILTEGKTEWIALARAQMNVRAGKQVQFVLPSYPEASYAEIRRALWLAALHGITNQTCRSERTLYLLQDEIEAMHKRLETPFVLDIAIRDSPAAAGLIPLMIQAQAANVLIGEGESYRAATTLRCQTNEVFSEGSSISFTSLSMAASFTQSCHSSNGLVFEQDGQVATNLFVRHFRDGTITAVNLTDAPRHNLLYRHGLVSWRFNLFPNGICHVLQPEPPRLSRNAGDNFYSGLWKITFEGNLSPRIVSAENLPTSVSEDYSGTIRYETQAIVPTGNEPLVLRIESYDSETEVLIEGHSLGTRLWMPFEWLVPSDYRGRNVPLEIRIVKRTPNGFLQTEPAWRRR